MQGEALQPVPARHASAGFNCVIEKGHALSDPSGGVETMTGSGRLGALDVVRICERSSEQHRIEKAVKLIGPETTRSVGSSRAGTVPGHGQTACISLKGRR